LPQIGPPTPNSDEWFTLRLTLYSLHHRVSAAGDARFRRLI